MPFKSKKQEAWAHTAAGQKALGGKKNVQEWQDATNQATLPGAVDAQPPFSMSSHISRVTKK